jgi:hypothetical protein
MCRTAGFARVDFKSVRDRRAHVICHRKWPEIARRGAGPELLVIENSEWKNHSFTAKRDDYLTVWSYSEEPNLTCDDLKVQVGPYATRPAGVRNIGTTWQATCKLPLGLHPGWHYVRIALRDSEFSAPARIPVDLPREERVSTPRGSMLKIDGVYDGRTWERNQVRAGLDSSVSVWVFGLPDAVKRTEVSVRLDGADLPACFVDPANDAKGTKQVNAILPAGLDRGDYQLTVRYRDEESPIQKIELF